MQMRYPNHPDQVKRMTTSELRDNFHSVISLSPTIDAGLFTHGPHDRRRRHAG